VAATGLAADVVALTDEGARVLVRGATAAELEAGVSTSMAKSETFQNAARKPMISQDILSFSYNPLYSQPSRKTYSVDPHAVSVSTARNTKEGVTGAAAEDVVAMAEDLDAATDATTLEAGARVGAREAELTD
jgi:hypothetical protein